MSERPPGETERREEPFPFEAEGLSLADWNRDLNRTRSQDQLLDHPNPAVRWIEARRRRTLGRHVRAALSGRKDAVVLDVGCGTAIVADTLREHVARVIYVDIDERVVASLPVHDPAEPRDGVASDLASLPFADGSVDLVIASAVLEHLPDPDGSLGELARVLRPGGSVVVCVPYDRLVVRLKGVLRRLGLSAWMGGLAPGLAPGHLHVFEGRELRGRLAAVGRIRRFCYDALCLCLFARVEKRDE